MVKLRIAAAILLTRGEGPELEVFLAERAPGLSFFGGYQAFLGGVVERADHDGDPEAHAALVRCAWRELFEEVGVLPRALAKLLDPAEREDLRARLMTSDRVGAAAAQDFRALLERCPELWQADSDQAPVVVGSLTTPPMAPVLYQTLFLRIELPEGESPSVIQGELVGGGFQKPQAALLSWLRGEALIVPPAVYFLSLLARHPGAEGWRQIQKGCASFGAGVLHEMRTQAGIWMAPLATETLPPATTTNAYWIGTDTAYLVDPASFEPGEQARLFVWIEARQAEGHRLAGIIATHHHHDHIGAIVPVAERYGVPVFGHPETLERLDLGNCETRELGDGDELPLGRHPAELAGAAQPREQPWVLRAYHTPGHDRGHLVLVENAQLGAIVGDLCSTVSSILIDPPEGHLATYLGSLRRMLEVPMGLLHPAHGPVHPDGHRLLQAYLKHRAEREARILGALEIAPKSLAELADVAYDDVLPEALPIARRALLAGLIKLAEDGQARELDGAWCLAGSGG